MNHHFVKDHKGNLPSPVAGMNMGSWLSQARTTEVKLEGFLMRKDLDILQRSKVEGLLQKIRSFIAAQLGLLNGSVHSKS